VVSSNAVIFLFIRSMVSILLNSDRYDSPVTRREARGLRMDGNWPVYDCSRRIRANCSY
jgi:hypothetical protein